MLPIKQADFIRVANNYYNSKKIDVGVDRIKSDLELTNFIAEKLPKLKKHKVAFVFICLNPLYWEFAPEMVRGAKEFFLPGHKTDFFFWTDIPEKPEDITKRMREEFTKVGVNTNDYNMIYHDIIVNGKQMNLNKITESVINLRKMKGVKVIPTETVPWPYPTLLRYNLFLQQEETLKNYDYIFYCDVDMQFVNIVGDEILGTGLTAAPHPGYAIRKELYPPYEPNQFSSAYIPRPGRLIQEGIKQRFHPEYYAGGLQGGKSGVFIQAMKDMKIMIDKDMAMNYIPIWNDETVWNKYLFENPPSVMLDPSYIYPDSLIKEYYEPIVWGRSYQPKLITLTKWFSLSKEGGEAVNKMIK